MFNGAYIGYIPPASGTGAVHFCVILNQSILQNIVGSFSPSAAHQMRTTGSCKSCQIFVNHMIQNAIIIPQKQYPNPSEGLRSMPLG
ncbi:MAG: hypothetical protein CVU41_18925 [Chloroflexi bacterium HGW-Chloroflexi-3]|nr:MAG: hypothetical protein CVU41_18925 [Chloroflexi bacterium HGW-Chloroflexi-3]